MSEKYNIARPYAKAAFAYAQSEQQISAWDDFLQNAANFIAHPRVKALLTDPRLSRNDVYGILSVLLGENLSQAQENFLRLVSQNRRLNLLPAMAQLFSELKTEQQQVIAVAITSAFALNKKQQERFVQALKIRLQRDIRLEVNVDPTLIGGAIIQSGDLVIDGSVQGMLARLNETLITG
jgi:F-type H+-transporting ATPase subunit delta